jgi:hypothetical protein
VVLSPAGTGAAPCAVEAFWGISSGNTQFSSCAAAACRRARGIVGDLVEEVPSRCVVEEVVVWGRHEGLWLGKDVSGGESAGAKRMGGCLQCIEGFSVVWVERRDREGVESGSVRKE